MADGTNVALSPELIFGVFVALELTKLYRAALDDAPQVHFQERGVSASPSGTYCTQSKDIRLVRHYVTHIDAQCALR